MLNLEGSAILSISVSPSTQVAGSILDGVIWNFSVT